MNKELDNKQTIFYSRAYRHLKPNILLITLYFLLVAVPVSILFLLNYTNITVFITSFSKGVLEAVIPGVNIGINEGSFLSYFGNINFLSVPNFNINRSALVLNLIITIVLLIICKIAKDKYKPFAIYSSINLLIHLASIVFFYFIPEKFPYTASDFSELYMKQMIGIWFTFLVASFILTGIMGKSGISKIITIIAISTYAFIFGIVRYIVFLWILSSFSNIYMAVLFFTFGPFVDFLYFITIYCMYVRYLTRKLNTRKGMVEWHWA